MAKHGFTSSKPRLLRGHDAICPPYSDDFGRVVPRCRSRNGMTRFLRIVEPANPMSPDQEPKLMI
ncbi:hypothetical protein K435DRAFT_868248 [Dendrothele bispora CBS 962.96]|uniref:Uncharacterized protein n=1 Tax=Dendrothele bispora (strain CBS 962.96) TaxID=1314807 RepID=A0A4V4HDD6_DENBC|nr:hypothetical protein K435DRAFT_868248 [Dendrothele bispora CBS 962.96]